MEDILILEDSLIGQMFMTEQIPEDLTHKIVSTTSELREYLDKGNQARLYFLDDNVPNAFGKCEFQFIENCTYLLKRLPKARVFYIGSGPGKKELEYCKRNKILLRDRSQVGSTIVSELIN